MTEILLSRKRSRSDEPNFMPQRKYLINERLAITNQEQIKKIHEKTIGLLFKGAKTSNENNNNIWFGLCAQNGGGVQLSGDGSFQFFDNIKPVGFPENPEKSKCCDKNAFVKSECINCNLKLCEHCGHNCSICKKLICQMCITIFDCGTLEQPCCDQCRLYQ